MHRTHRSLVGLLALAVSLWPLAGAVHAQDVPEAMGPLMTVDQVRGAFGDAGYQVGQSHTWEWTYPPVTTFDVRDRGDRVVMVLVYPSQEAAQTGRLLAEAHETAQISGLGPHLVIGYGPSTWSGNVALVESTETSLERLARAQADRDNGLYVEQVTAQPDLSQSTLAVDLDFQQALRNGAVNL